jgi:hypothetical protein
VTERRPPDGEVEEPEDEMESAARPQRQKKKPIKYQDYVLY